MSVAGLSGAWPRIRHKPGWWVLAGGVVLLVASAPLSGMRPPTADDALFLVQSAVVAVAAAWLLARRGSNRFGLLLAVIFLVGAQASAAHSYARTDPELAFATTIGWFGVSLVSTSLLGLTLVFLPLLFPDGRLPSPRWRPLAYAGVAGTVVFCVSLAIQPGDLEGLSGIANPYAAPRPVVDATAITGGLLLVAAICGAIASLVVRYRRGDDRVRVQVRWLTSTMALLVAGIIVLNIVTAGNPSENVVLDAATGFLIMAGLPLVAAVAILYDDVAALDRLIRRTVVYAVLWILITSVILAVPIGLGLAARERAPFALAVLITSVVTLAVQPIRERLLQVADRLAADLGGRAEAADRRSAELAASRSRIVAAALDERRRIQRDLHDGAQQELVALIAKIRFLREQYSDDGLQPVLADLQHDAVTAMGGIRDLAHGIHPPLLTDHGLAPALEDRVDRLPLPVAVEVADGLRTRRFAGDIEATGYFVVSEALANVIKHAEAGSAVVSLESDGDVLRITVSDDGHGMANNTVRGSGLTGLADRVEAVGGNLSTHSEPGAGTIVIAELPALPPEPRHG